MPLLVCRTCPRDRPDSGSFGVALEALLHSDVVRVRHVPCLGGCPNAGNAAVDGPGKPRVRFWLFDLEWARSVGPFGTSALWGPVAA